MATLRAQHAAAKGIRGRRPQRRQRVTPQVPPSAIARSYLGALLVVIRAARAAVKQEVETGAKELALRAAQGHSVHDEIAARVARAQSAWTRNWPAPKIAALVQTYAERTSRHQRAEFIRQLKGPLGVEVRIADARTPARLRSFVVEGVAKVQDLVARYFSQVRAVVMHALRPAHHDAPPDGSPGGEPDPSTPNYELEASVSFDRFVLDLGKRGDAAEGYGAQLADLSVRGLFADLNQDRQKELGLDEYVWETMEDDRVRPEHAALHGRTFSWDDPPDIGNPGEEPNCRCQATPKVDALQADLGPAAGGGDDEA